MTDPGTQTKSISVVITTYKRKHEYLDAAVESVMKQTYPPVEIILVDDNGTGTEFQRSNEEAYAGKEKIVYIANDWNRGAQYSRNAGILHSKGEFVAFLDDDDLWHPEKLEKQIRLFTKEEIGLVFCRGYTFRDNDLSVLREYHGKGVFIKNPSFQDILDMDHIGSTTQALVRKSCFDKAGMFDPDMPARQDYEMWIRIMKYYIAAGVDEPLFYHRIHGGEQISKDKAKILTAYETMLKKHKEDFRKNPKGKLHKEKIVAGYYRDRKQFVRAVLIMIRGMLEYIFLSMQKRD